MGTMRLSSVRLLGGGVLLALGAAYLSLGGSIANHQPVPADRCASGGDGPPTLQATILNASSALALPSGLGVVGQYVVVIDDASDSVLHVLDRHDGIWVRSLGRRGRGPGEFRGAWSLDPVVTSPPSVWVYDLPLRRLTHVPLLPHPTPRRVEPRSVHLMDGAVLTGPHWLTPDSIVTAGFLVDARLAVYDSTGRRIGSLGTPGRLINQPIQATQARLTAHPQSRVLALASRYTSHIELVRLASRTVETVAGPIPVNDGRTTVDLDRFGYVDVAATPNRIVALFSGRESQEFGPRATLGACLHIFDWQGTFKEAYRLDSDVLAIAASRDGELLYAIRHEPTPAVVRFTLPGGGPLRAAAAAGTSADDG
jgi:hypothetical protein